MNGIAAWIARSDLLALSSLFALAALLMSRQIFLGGTFDNRDIVLQSIPVYSWYAENLRQGSLPIWSPSILCGFPLAFTQYGFFYPPDMLLFWLLDAARAFHLSLAMHLALAGMTTYWYCRVLGLRRLPSFFAAVVFQMGNEPLAWPANGFITKTLFVLPALLACVELMYRRSARHWLVVPPVVGAGLLVGYAQFVLVGLLIAGAYLLVLAAIDWRSAGVARSLARVMLFGAGALLGVGLAAVRVLPTAAVTAVSVRAGGLSFERSAVDSIHPLGLLLGNLLPPVYELPVDLGGRPDYVGAPVLFLALLALASVRSLGYAGRFHAGLALVAATLSLGSFTPLYELVWNLPSFSYFRVPGRFSIVLALSLSVLAALALDRHLVKALPGWPVRCRALVAAGAVASAVALAAVVLTLSFHFGRDPLSASLRPAILEGQWHLLSTLRLRVALPLLALAVTPWLLVACARGRISPRALERAALGISAVTLFALGWLQNPWLAPAVLEQTPVLLDTIRRDADLFRVLAWWPGRSAYNATVYFTEVFESPPDPGFVDRYTREALAPNSGLLYGVTAVDGYEALQSRRQALLTSYIGSERRDEGRFADGELADHKLLRWTISDRVKLLEALNVRYLIADTDIQDSRLQQVSQVPVQLHPEAEFAAAVALYSLEALPRTFLTPASVLMDGEEEVLEALVQGAVDLRGCVILEEEPPELVTAPLTHEGSNVEVLRYGNEQVILRTRTDGSGFLVLMDFLLPGWSATVNGEPARVLAANFAGRAVPIVDAGDYEVVFSYEAPLFREGLAISLASLAVLTLFGVGSRIRVTSRTDRP